MAKGCLQARLFRRGLWCPFGLTTQPRRSPQVPTGEVEHKYSASYPPSSFFTPGSVVARALPHPSRRQVTTTVSLAECRTRPAREHACAGEAGGRCFTKVPRDKAILNYFGAKTGIPLDDCSCREFSLSVCFSPSRTHCCFQSC